MKTHRNVNRRIVAAYSLALCGLLATGIGCTQNETDAVLAGVQAAAHELDSSNNNVTFLDWISSELNN